MSNVQQDFTAAQRQAERASRQGDLALAERWSKIAERLALAIKNAAPEPEEDVEAIRARLRARIARFVEAGQARDDWEARKAAYLDVYEKLAAQNATLPPLPPSVVDDAMMDAIGRGEA